MNYLVTGGLGFIGSHVVCLLASAGHDVVIVDQNTDAEILRNILPVSIDKRIDVFRADIGNYKALLQKCRGYKIDRLIHTAAVIGSQNPLLTTAVNCQGTVNILELSKILDIKRVVLVSSLAVFGPQEKYAEEYIPDDAPHFPANIYGASKSFCEHCADYYYNAYSLDAISIRLTHVYGYGRMTEGVGKVIDDELFVKPAMGKTGIVPNGDSINNWIYVEDAARALVMASQVDKTRLRAFTAGGFAHSIHDAVDYIKALIPDANIKLLPGKGIYPYNFDTNQIKEQIGYEPVWPLKRGIEKYINRIRSTVA